MMVHTARCLISSFGARKGARVLSGPDAPVMRGVARLLRWVGLSGVQNTMQSPTFPKAPSVE